ncbi:MAG: hypothetical protein ACRET1_00480 [Burkholderiales bacterium]
MATIGERVNVVDMSSLMTSRAGEWASRTRTGSALGDGYYVVLRTRRTPPATGSRRTYFGPFEFAAQARTVFDHYLKPYAAHVDTRCVAYLVRHERMTGGHANGGTND